MNFIDFYKMQLGESEENNFTLEYSDFLNEYYHLFCKFNSIEISKDRLLNIITENIKEIKENRNNELLKFSSWLKSKIIEITDKLRQQFNIDDIPETVLFIGDGSIDGHGVVIENQAYGLFEISTLVDSIKLYNADVFLAHELIHPIHYQLNSGFFAGKWNSIEEYYFKRLISEGIATYFSKDIVSTRVEEGYWFGFLKDQELQEWINYCEENKSIISSKLAKSLNKEELDLDLYRQLFSIVGYENLTKFRLAYYYGTCIIEKINKNHTFEQILELGYKDLRNYIVEYFDINRIG